MKIVRIKTDSGILHARFHEGAYYPIIGDIFGEHTFASALEKTTSIKILAPVIPPNIIAIGLNYRQHAIESNMKIPENPVLFLKATTSVVGPDEEIVLPLIAPLEVDYEAELTVVIGRTAKNVTEEDALNYVYGYTVGNDVSARDCQLKYDSQWARGKSFDTFCPIGPWIETVLEPDKLKISTRLNGKIVQDSCTSDMIFNVPQIVSYCSHNMTLLPGTIILTGTPQGVGFARKPPLFLRDNDVIEVEIEDIGVLRNTIRHEKQ